MPNNLRLRASWWKEFSREGATLRFRGKIMGTMPVSAVVTPGQVRKLIAALGFKLILFAISMVFRRNPRDFDPPQ